MRRGKPPLVLRALLMARRRFSHVSEQPVGDVAGGLPAMVIVEVAEPPASLTVRWSLREILRSLLNVTFPVPPAVRVR